MIPLSRFFEVDVPENISDERTLVRWAKQKNIIPKEKRQTPRELKDGEYAVPRREKTKTKIINPKTGRLKNKKKIKFLITKLKPEDRTFKNLPRYASQGKQRGKSIVRFQDWLELHKPKGTPNTNASFGKAKNGKWCGWSHRAVYCFGIGDKIKPGSIGNKYRVNSNNVEIDEKENFKPYLIKTDKDAMEHAIRFAKEVS
ncbi:MAG: hypothetical protein ACTSXD_04755 [Candidatus Heimdallarchaeaceae archaeon]